MSMEDSKKGFVPSWKKSIAEQRQDSEIRHVIHQNALKAMNEKKPRPDLIDNFHWAIMRVRRSKKITLEQMSSAISEPILVLKRAEMGLIPEGEYGLITKIENYLGITLVKNKEMQKPQTKPLFGESKEFSFEKKVPEDLTILDLKKISSEKTKEKDLFDD